MCSSVKARSSRDTDAEHLGQKIISELDEGTRHLVLEVSAVPRVDSSGLGLMVRLLMRARKAGGDLKIACPPAFVTSLLEMTRLSTLFHVFASEQEAVVSYRKPAPQLAKPASTQARILFSINPPTSAPSCEPC